MTTPRLWQFDPLAPTAPAAVAWPAWLAFAALVLAVGLVERALTLPGRERQRLASAAPVWLRRALRVGAAQGSLPGDGALWRLVQAPDGTLAVLSDRAPGPCIGAPGELSGWTELDDPPAWVGFDAALETAREWNEGRRGS